MNIIEFWTFIILYFGGLLSLIVFVLRWVYINNTIISVSYKENNINKIKGFRGRIAKDGNFYGLRQFRLFKPKLQFKNIDFTKEINNFVDIEGMPLISPKQCLNIIKNEEQYKSWVPPYNIKPKEFINNSMIIKINNIREDLWESTDNTTKADMFYKLIIPIGLIILATACLIFFPKMYEQIMSYYKPGIESAAQGWIESIKNTIIPMG